MDARRPSSLKVLERLQEIQPTGLEFDVITYCTTFSAFEKAKQSNKALVLFQEMRQKCLEPNMIMVNAAISACELAELSDKALELLEDRQKVWSQMGSQTAHGSVHVRRPSSLTAHFISLE